ncbi:DUF1778 domain-containing protein [Bradyrhizobium sp.]|uniref:type II toxin -antitoxin system TacA 1-like antitoxin n=1 Tax=Bradyrhizobium sp. TaxID=376 RepID=UPI001D55DA0E|nr:DUF1778 domain-containing protein [Bradyrhizobium sp.]MBI5319157.1 DUF1778 domain-containing protein [Bradyrhizobium sp.]
MPKRLRSSVKGTGADAATARRSPAAATRSIDVVLDQRLFVLEPDQHRTLMQVLDDPVEPGPKLRWLLHRTPAWQK